MAGMKMSHTSTGNGNGNGNCRCSMRVYYDPFVAEWRGWYSDEHWPIYYGCLSFISVIEKILM